MSEIMCKCGHPAQDHATCGCMVTIHKGGLRGFCPCLLTPKAVETNAATTQLVTAQARIATLKAAITNAINILEYDANPPSKRITWAISDMHTALDTTP